LDNNALAMATLMIIPLMIYLAQTVSNRWIRYGLYVCAIFSLVSVVGSYSRGGFVGLAAIAIAVWWRAKNKLAIGTVAMITIVIGVALLPQKWLNRMDTIQNYEQDQSATGRLEIWGHAIRIANDRPLVGGGFGVFDDEQTYSRLSPEMINRRNVHSIYFEMLGTQGYVGLIIFVILGAAGLAMSGNIMRRTNGVPGLEHEYKFARAVQISLIAYAVCGAFLNLSTWDLYYVLLAMIVIQRTLLEEKLASGPIGEAPATELDRGAGLGLGPAQVAVHQHMPGRSFLRRPAK
jgi:probable O-glycosylation ligase (exosortase A-associated)